MEDLSHYENLREAAQKFYNSIGKIHSPAFKQDIFFTSEGFNHIIFKRSRAEREKSSQILRFNLLRLAIKLLEIPTTYQEFEEITKEFEIKSYKRRIKKNKIVSYWGIIAIINNRKIKIIIRKIGENGKMHFWSIIPAWITNTYRDIRLFSTMKGNPEED